MPSTLLELLRARHASRAIDTREIAEDTVRELIEAASLAPSCFNKQPWRFVFITGVDALATARSLLTPGNASWASRAPLLVLGYSAEDDDCVTKDGRAYHQFDLGLATMNLMLMATERGLIARPMAGFDSAKASEAFSLPATSEPLVMIAVGYPDSDENQIPEENRGMGAKPRSRKPLEEIAKRL